MAIIDDFKGLNEALRRIQGRLRNLPDGQAPGPNAPPPVGHGLPCGQAVPPPGVCSYCRGSGFVMHPGNKPYPCPQCKGDEEVKF
jgi:hypothetical protein